MRITSAGHFVFALMMIAVGVIGLHDGNFTAVWGGMPKDFPSREVWAVACMIFSIAVGAGLLFRPTAAIAAPALFLAFAVFMAAFRVPLIIHSPLVEGSYQNNGETAVLVAAAWVLYARLAGDWAKGHLGFLAGPTGVRLAQVLYGLALIAFGLSHFAYLNLTAPLVPPWLPPNGTFWAYFTGAAYCAAGVAIVTGVFARLAAALVALQIFGITLLVWVPMVAAGHIEPFRWQETVMSFVLSAAALVIAESYGHAPWLALRPGRA
jgi:uncharacterized membrane protein